MDLEELPHPNADALHAALFSLLDRDRSGYAQEGDALAALACGMQSEDRAHRMLARLSEDGRPNAMKFRTLIEACVDLARSSGVAPTSSVRQGMLVKMALAIVRDFERRATQAEQFREAAAARDVMKQIRASEEARQYGSLEQRQLSEKEGVESAQSLEASEFSRTWQVFSCAPPPQPTAPSPQPTATRYEANHSRVPTSMLPVRVPPMHGRDQSASTRILRALSCSS